jgi:8-oxo-dGTP pyrophosphatase MutT (NUDIX family)
MTYSTPYDNEQNFSSEFLALLQHSNCYFRDHLPGHLTGSACIIDESKQFMLLTHHAKLNKWLQPGGHADGDENILAVALREAEEETGLKNFTPLIDDIFDIDIHTIPARKDLPEHFHFDVRFLFQASRMEDLVISEESHDLAWVHINEIAQITNQNIAMMRMADKVKSH